MSDINYEVDKDLPPLATYTVPQLIYLLEKVLAALKWREPKPTRGFTKD